MTLFQILVSVVNEDTGGSSIRVHPYSFCNERAARGFTASIDNDGSCTSAEVYSPYIRGRGRAWSAPMGLIPSDADMPF